MDSQLDTIRVGKKEVWAYVTACITSFNSGCKELTIRARGSAISKAVDVVNSLERSFLRKVEVKEIKISSDELDDGNKKVWKSAIEIKIAVS
ncbi:MAG: RNA-binding protein [Candidatus Brockarchaeota archaeon]|nr:RNA-binding protein [Candidatus Brockarchaeota archaeon]